MSKPDDLNMPLIDATAGAAGALLTTCMLSPVDVAKTRMQTGRSKEGTIATIRQIFDELGVEGLFKGLPMKGVETVLRNFLYFYAYEWLKATYYRLGFRPSTLGHTACGVLAGVSNLTVTMPIDTLNVRVQSDSRSTATIAREMLDEGVETMWRGFGVSSILTLNPALTFAVFDALKARVLRRLKRKQLAGGGGSVALTVSQAFVLGSVSKVVATLLTYPLMRAKSIMQTRSMQTPVASVLTPPPRAVHANGTANGKSDTPTKNGQANGGGPPAVSPAKPVSAAKAGFVRVLLDVLEQEGVGGLYRGCAAQIFTAVTKSGILLSVKEQLAAFAMSLVLLLSRRRLK